MGIKDMENRHRPARRGAFTLIELLLVIAIMLLMMALIVPALNGIADSMKITTASQTLIDSLRLARQNAITKNSAVEYRIFNVPSKDGGAKAYRAVQSLTVDEAGVAKALDAVQYLPQSVVLSGMTTYSSLLAPSLPAGTDSAGREYKSFRFRPDGSTDLSPVPPQKWFATIVPERAADSATLPANFITIQVNPTNGNVVFFRP